MRSKQFDNGIKAVVVVCLSLLLHSLLARTVLGDVLILRDPVARMSGRIVQQDSIGIRFQSRAADGSVEFHAIAKSRVVLAVRTLRASDGTDLEGSVKRDPEQQLREVERLLAMRNDWEARYLGFRLLDQLLESKEKKDSFRLAARWLAASNALSKSDQQHHVLIGMSEFPKEFSFRSKQLPDLPFPDRLTIQEAKNWAVAIRMLRQGKGGQAKVAIQAMRSPFDSEDLSHFFDRLQHWCDQPILDQRVVDLLRWEIQFQSPGIRQQSPVLDRRWVLE